MKTNYRIAIAICALMLATVHANQPAPQATPTATPTPQATPTATPTPQATPTASPQTPRSQAPDLGRPTKITDEVPLFNFEEYFTGKWTFEGEAPEGALGAGGLIKGTVVYKKVEGPFFEATTTATGPAGAFTIKELIGYRKEGKTSSRWVVDSRGFSFLQLASVGGDLGGYFNLYYESQPFTYKGKTLRVKNALRLTSPVRYRNTMTVSTDGGPFVAYGSPWFEKDLTAPTPNR